MAVDLTRERVRTWRWERGRGVPVVALRELSGFYRFSVLAIDANGFTTTDALIAEAVLIFQPVSRR